MLTVALQTMQLVIGGAAGVSLIRSMRLIWQQSRYLPMRAAGTMSKWWVVALMVYAPQP